MIRAALSTSFLCCLLFAFGCDSTPYSAPQGTITPTRDQLYRLHCSGCHGDGSGNGHIAGTLAVRPRNLKHHGWQTSVTDEHIYEVIRGGGEAVKLNKAMPAFEEKLSERDIQMLVKYIRYLGD